MDFSSRYHSKNQYFVDYIQNEVLPHSLIVQDETTGGKLYLGGLTVMLSGEAANLFDHIISVINKRDLEYFTHPDVVDSKKLTHTRFYIEDEHSSDIYRIFDYTSRLINDLLQQGKCVYVHCFMGVSRSSTIVLAYLMKYKKLNFQDAIMMLHAKRKCVNPNYSFRLQLERWKKDN